MNETVITDTQREVLEGVRAGHALRDIGVALGYSKQYISQVVKRLTSAGLLSPAGRGRYVVTDEPCLYQRRPQAVEAMLLSSPDATERAIVWLEREGYEVSRIRADDSEAVLGLTFVPRGKVKAARVDAGEWLVRDGDLFHSYDVDKFASLYEAVA